MVKLTRTYAISVIQTLSCPHTREPAASLMAANAAIKLGIDVHQDFYVVVMQVDGTNPKPPQRFEKQAFLHWAAKLKRRAARSARGV